MRLLIDIGNTRIKWALLKEHELFEQGQCMHAEVTAAFDQIGEHELQGIYWTCVAEGKVQQEIQHYVAQRWGRAVTALETSGRCCGVSNGYEQPERLGVDRWAAVIAARQLFQGAVCVVDCGSAVTVDVLDAGGDHLGGYIVPGLLLQQEFLRSGTAAVDVSETQIAGSGWGRNTDSCVVRGSAEAVAGLIERSSRELAKETGGEVTIIVTGGDAMGILPLLGMEAHYEEHLVLQGMAYMIRELEG